MVNMSLYVSVYHRSQIWKWKTSAVRHECKHNGVDIATRSPYVGRGIRCGSLRTKIACVGIAVHWLDNVILLGHMHYGIADGGVGRHSFVRHFVAKSRTAIVRQYSAVSIRRDNNICAVLAIFPTLVGIRNDCCRCFAIYILRSEYNQQLPALGISNRLKIHGITQRISLISLWTIFCTF